MRRPLVLASASPRRRELLGWLGVPFEIQPAALEERRRAGEAPAAYVRRIATEKALAVAAHHPDALVLGADTEVVLGDAVLGKPRDAGHAREMLARLSGRTHEVISAVALVGGDEAETKVVVSRVRFDDLDPDRIDAYVATGEPLDKAGAYALQGRGAALIRWMEGSPSAVIGLPLAETAALLAARGVRPEVAL